MTMFLLGIGYTLGILTCVATEFALGWLDDRIGWH